MPLFLPWWAWLLAVAAVGYALKKTPAGAGSPLVFDHNGARVDVRKSEAGAVPPWAWTATMGEWSASGASTTRESAAEQAMATVDQYLNTRQARFDTG